MLAITHTDGPLVDGKRALSERAANMTANVAEAATASGIAGVGPGVRRTPHRVPLSPDALCLIMISTTDVLTLAFLCLYMWFRFYGYLKPAPRV